MKRILILLSIFLIQFCFSQTHKKKIDSLWSIVNDKNSYAERGSKEILRLCTEIYYQSKEIQYEQRLLDSLVKMSEIYLNEGNSKETIVKAKEGIILAEKNEDYTNLTLLLMFKGRALLNWGYYDRSMRDFKKSLKLTDYIPDKDKMHNRKMYLYSQISRNLILSKSGNFKDSMIFYSKKSFEEASKLSSAYNLKNQRLSAASRDLAVAHRDLNQIQRAEFFLDKADSYIIREKDQREQLYNYFIRADIEYLKKNYTKSIEMNEKAVEIANKYNMITRLKDIYPRLAKSYNALGDFKNETFYLKETQRISDSLEFEKNKTIDSVVSEKVKDDEPLFSLKFIWACAFLVIVILLFYFVYKAGLITKINNPLENDSITQEKLDTEKLDSVMKLAKQNIDSFYFKFTELFPTFEENLLKNNPKLTVSDLEYCALIKLKFDNKQIATYKNVTVGSVESKKHRIRKKLNLSPEENLQLWLINI